MDMISILNLSVADRVNGISLQLQQGEIIGIVGPNGAGKSSLLNAIAGIENFSGDVFIKQRQFTEYKPKQRARLVGYLPQTIGSVWSLNVKDVVSLGRMPWGDEDGRIIENAMREAAVDQFADRDINELSGGERARVWLARVLAGQPQILIADEPIASLDIHYQIEVMKLLRSFVEHGNSVMIAIHDLSLAARYCDRLCLLNQGKMMKQGRPDEVLTEAFLTEAFQLPVYCDLQRDPPIVLPR